MRSQIRMSFVSLALAAIVLIVAVGVLWAEDPTAASSPPADRSIPTRLSLPAGIQAKDLNEDNDIRSTLATVTEHGVTKDQFNDLCDDLVKQDKDRIGEYQDRDVTKLNGRIDQIRRAFKEKYAEDFDFDDQKVVFNDQFTIVEGEVTDPAVAVVMWPAPSLSGEAMKASETQRPDAARDKTEAAQDAKLDKGRNVALVRFPAMHGKPELIVSMVHQMPDNWKIDIPNTRTGQQVYEDLLTQLTWIGENTDKWPASKDDAYRLFAHHIVCALYGTPMQGMDRPNTR